jgi:acetolactate synthase-1/2/3 large subunit
MPKLTGGEAVVKSLIAHGVGVIFGLPGVQNDHLYNALYHHQNQLRVIHTRHEQGAAYMALGYAQASDKAGVYSVVPGPGLLNTTAALATAYSLNSKVLCLTGQIRSDQIGRGFGMLHEIPNQLEIIQTLTKWAARITSPTDAPSLVAEAFRQMASGRPRPVGLEVPPDVLARQVEVDLPPVAMEIRTPPPDSDQIEEAAKLLGQAKQPMIFVGSGAVHAAEEIKHLAEALQAPVVAGASGLGILSSRDPLSLSYVAAHSLWPQVDVVLAVGTRMQRPRQNWGADDQLKVIHIDIDPEEQFRIGRPDVGLVADSKEALNALIPAVEKYNKSRPSRAEELAAVEAEIDGRLAYLEPQMTYLKVLREALPDDGIFVSELTQVGYVSRIGFPVYRPKTYISLGYQGTLGGGFAMALGAKVANPDKPVLSIAGDGGFMFTVQELATAVQHGINTVTIVFNDGAYGNVRRMQKQDYGGTMIATELRNPDFVKLAEAFGAQGLRAETPEQLREAIDNGFAANVPTLIDVPTGEMPSPARSLWYMTKVRG